MFEYPAGSGKWYTGKHEPIITKELYEKAQEQLTRDKITRGESKEFAFTRLMTCGFCGSGVCAEEKFKTLKSTGTTARYVYYGCNRSRNLHCGNTYIREEELIKKLVALIGEMEINGGAIKKKFDEEYERMQKFQKAFLGAGRVSARTEDPDPRQYATHVLTEGTTEERRELLGCLKSRLILKNREVVLGKE